MKLMKVLIFLVFLSSCKIDRDRQVERDKFTFKTGDDTELFFKNMRQSYYDLEENRAAKFNVFRHEERTREAEYPVINLAIVINYMQDEAYLLVEPNQILQDLDRIEVNYDMEPGKSGVIVLEQFNREAMLEFASQVYEALRKNAQFYIVRKDKHLPLLESSTEREVFRVTVADYYRLTRIY